MKKQNSGTAAVDSSETIATKEADPSEAAKAVVPPPHDHEGDVFDVPNPFEKKEMRDYLNRLSELRADGEDRVNALKQEIADVNANKQIDEEVKNKIILADKEAIIKAKEVKEKNKQDVKAIINEAKKKAYDDGRVYYEKTKAIKDRIYAEAKAELKSTTERLLSEHKAKAEEIKASNQVQLAKDAYEKSIKEARDAFESSSKDAAAKNAKEVAERSAKKAFDRAKNDFKTRQKAEDLNYRSLVKEARSLYDDRTGKAKDALNNAYLAKYGYQGELRNSRHSILESLEFSARHYAYNFNLGNFFLKNALYIVILVFYIVCVILSDGGLIEWNSIVSILGQSSSKMFFSLGVAGLILLAGTDLSIGRMTGMGAMIVCMMLGKLQSGYSAQITLNNQTVVLFTINTLGIPTGVRVFLALLVSIVVCVLFSAIAGFFTAKFKMHPFITTLSTQLVIFGVMMVLFGSYSAANMDTDIKKSLDGENDVILIILAAIAILVVWFIWNKTKFGKNMYAVGGNAEAASVSGINVFWTILMVFIMAGVLYGCGGFVEAVRVGTANPSSGTGTELDAIAACVIGGISFSGGIGKISGAVIGTIIFTGLTVCLTYLGLDVNFQFVFKGIIIMAAVCLDSLKYLKKK